MTDIQFYVFVGLGVVGIICIWDVARLLTHVCRGLDRVNFNVAHLQTLGEHWNADMQQRVYGAAAAADRASGYLNELVQPMREAQRRRQDAEFGIYR